MTMARPSGYSRLQIVLHWAVVVLVALQYLLHDGIADAYDTALETGVYSMGVPVLGHAADGALILLLACWRLILRHDRGVPPSPASEPAAFARLSRLAHLGFYLLLILLPVTGALAWGGRMEAAGDAHEVLRALLLVLILAHVGAVVVHQFVWKTGVMARMLRADS